MTNSELVQRLESLILSERKISHQIVLLIQLADARKLYLEEGYGSLLDWLTKRFKYSASAAYRRIQTAKLLSSLPEQTETLRDKIHSGVLNITTLSKVQSFIKEEEKRSGTKVSSEMKAEILGQIENQSIQTTEKILFQTFPDACLSFQQERVAALSDEEFRVSVTLSEESLAELKRVQELLGHHLTERIACGCDFLSFKRLPQASRSFATSDLAPGLSQDLTERLTSGTTKQLRGRSAKSSTSRQHRSGAAKRCSGGGKTEAPPATKSAFEPSVAIGFSTRSGAVSVQTSANGGRLWKSSAHRD